MVRDGGRWDKWMVWSNAILFDDWVSAGSIGCGG